MVIEVNRVIGARRGGAAGPLLIVVVGMHGNEPAAIPASRRVLDYLLRETPRFRGELRVLAGNLTALSLGRRYVDEDLNRIWQPGRVREADRRRSGGTREAAEQAELLAEVRRAASGAGEGVCFLDLHTTSAPGAPFSILADTAENRTLASRLPGAMVLGLDTHLDGTFLNFINRLGFPAVGFEGGQHDDPRSVDAHELAIWETLTMMGCLEDCPRLRFDELSERLADLASDRPDSVEIICRHPVRPGDGFVMEPGFRNLQRVEAGRLLAHDRHGPIRASGDARILRILMPLYQLQGNDGFFLAREIRQEGR